VRTKHKKRRKKGEKKKKRRHTHAHAESLIHAKGQKEKTERRRGSVAALPFLLLFALTT
jgi:hypothetical protein